MTDIFDAIRANDTGMLRRILAENPEAIHEQYKENLNFLPIHFAAHCNADLEIFDILFEYKADINTQQTNWECNVLELALSACSFSKVKYFLSLGAKIHPERNIITFAAYNPDADVIRYFLEQGEPFDTVSDYMNMTPIFPAACNPNTDVLQALLDREASLTGINARGFLRRFSGQARKAKPRKAAQAGPKLSRAGSQAGPEAKPGRKPKPGRSQAGPEARPGRSQAGPKTNYIKPEPASSPAIFRRTSSGFRQ